MTNLQTKSCGDFAHLPPLTRGRVLILLTSLLSAEMLFVVLNLWPTPWRTVNRLFLLDLEPTLPTWFASAQLLLMSLTAAIIGRWRLWGRRERFVLYLLAAIFLYISVDEVAIIHETFGGAIAKDTGFYAWKDQSWLFVFFPITIAGCAILGYAIWRVFAINPRALVLGMIGALLWLVSLGAETLNGLMLNRGTGQAAHNLPIIEEFCELAGASILWCALLETHRNARAEMEP